MKLLYLLLLMLAAPFAQAQMPFDCTTALEVCDGAVGAEVEALKFQITSF